jgi:hypothetical protein
VAEADVDLYYERLLEPEQLRKQGKTARALAVALDLLELVPALIEETTIQPQCPFPSTSMRSPTSPSTSRPIPRIY